MLDDNLTSYGDKENSFRGIADLCVEAVSDTSRRNREQDIKTKRSEYAVAGVREYYMLDGSGKSMAFLHRNAAGVFAPIPPEDRDVIRSAVLPGFQFRLADLYRQSSAVEMSEDPLYRHFALPELRAARVRAEQERERAERLAAKQRALGIDDEAL